MDLFLGIDGGASGCRAALADGAGRVIGRGSAGPANIHADPEGALANILAAAGAALGAVAPAQVVACLGLAGAGFAAPRAWLEARLPFARALIVHDATTSLAGALGAGDGIVAAMGTGSVFSRRRAGEVLTIGGWGIDLGDEGSGAWLGRLLLARIAQAQDGMVADSDLGRAVLAELGGSAAMVDFAAAATTAKLATLAPRIIAAADADPMAAAVAAAGIAQVAAVIDRLQEGRALPVCFTGGLGPFYARRLGLRWPVVAPQGSALDGALRMARDLVPA